MPKNANGKNFGHPILQTRPQYSQITTTNMVFTYLNKANFSTQCHIGFISRLKFFFNNKSENHILRNHSQNNLGILRGDLRMVGCQMTLRHPAD